MDFGLSDPAAPGNDDGALRTTASGLVVWSLVLAIFSLVCAWS